MKNVKINVKDWLWVLYPIVVVIGVFVGLVTLFGDGGQRMANLNGAQEQIALQKAELARLQQKERLLKAVDVERETATLTRLTNTMPATKKVWLLVSELAAAGAEAGVPLTDMNGVIGDVKDASDAAKPVPVAAAGTNGNLSIEATYEVANFDQVKTIVEKLARALPLVRINSLSFQDTDLVIVAEGAWSSWKPVSAEADSPLPDITSEVAQVEARLTEFEELPGAGTAAGEFLSTANPF